MNTKVLATPRPKRRFFVRLLQENGTLSPDRFPMRARYDSEYMRYTVLHNGQWYHLSYETDGTPWIDPTRPIPSSSFFVALRNENPQALYPTPRRRNPTL